MIAQFFGHTIRTEPADGVEPGHQVIYVGPVGVEARAILFTLTGLAPGDQAVVLDKQNNLWVMATHNALADARITQLVDICVDLRFSAPGMLQLGLKLDEAANAT